MKKTVLLALILSLAFGLRIFKLADRPFGFTWDEAALGYNAYSLLLTGRDEHQKILPIIFKSFGDFKPGLYIYFTVPTITSLGLNEFATRLPSAILGVLLIVIVYIWTKNIWTILLLVINPWALHFSRGAWEANLALFLTTLGIVLLSKKRYLMSALFLGLTFWSYQGAKLFTPLILLSYFLIYKPEINKLLKPFLLLLLLLLPIIFGLSTQSGRLRVFSVFSYSRSIETFQQILKQDQNNKLAFVLFHSEIYDQTRGIIQRYLNYFSPRFLFFEGDWTNLRHTLPYHGYFYVIEIITLFVGLILIIRRWNKFDQYMILWLLAAPIPAALSRDLVSGVRALPMIIPLVIISGVGLKKLTKNKFYIILFMAIFIISFLHYLDLYYVHDPRFSSEEWLSFYKPAWKIVLREQSDYQKIIFTDKFGQPYIFGLFYGHIRPQDYWLTFKAEDNSQGDVGQVLSFGKFEFRPISWLEDRKLSDTLFVGTKLELPDTDLQDTQEVSDITYPNGDHALRIVGNP